MYSNLPFCGITTLAMTNFKLTAKVWLRMAQRWRACLVCVKHWGKSPTLKKQIQTINGTVPCGHNYSSQASFYQTPSKLHTFQHSTAGHMDLTWGTWTRFYGLDGEPLKVHSRGFWVVRAGGTSGLREVDFIVWSFPSRAYSERDGRIQTFFPLTPLLPDKIWVLTLTPSPWLVTFTPEHTTVESIWDLNTQNHVLTFLHKQRMLTALLECTELIKTLQREHWVYSWENCVRVTWIWNLFGRGRNSLCYATQLVLNLRSFCFNLSCTRIYKHDFLCRCTKLCF